MNHAPRCVRRAGPVGSLGLVLGGMCLASQLWAGAATAAPASVVATGSFQSEIGCIADFQPGCANSALAYDATDDVWQRVLNLPARAYTYIATLNGSFTERYGLNAQPGGANISLAVPTAQAVKFYYDDKSKWVTDNISITVAILPSYGSVARWLGAFVARATMR